MRVLSGSELFEDRTRLILNATRFLRSVEALFPNDYREMMQSAHLWCYDGGESVIQEGDSAGSVFLVVSGSVSVRSSRVGELAVIGAGEWLGDMSLFSARSRTADVQVESSVARLLMIPKNILQPADSKLSDDFKRYIYESISQGIRWKLEQAKIKHPSPELNESLIRLARLPARGGVEDFYQLLTEMAVSLQAWNTYRESETIVS
ncbi:cyclic nucleotide-binding domain-containing protein [Umboniibacter marinipuniceus]|uniref:CRP-like cAMP-binding protein n=1 Tax=Umboniibacter marinipuniceus TaxID=569599 RepID=A0A3M0ALU3_9GAMM|nr:cyclic nucleotide-binding domain-containing protein [Umboniibacter marinipuniceus]RMA79952.1 CRP-like cAMP-binding protein [Umboniibacter marinipuniceus]